MSKLIEYSTIGFFIIVSVFLYFGFKSYSGESEACLNNPLVYGAKKIEEANGAKSSFTGILLKPNSPTLQFNGEGQQITYPYSNSQITVPNLTQLFEHLTNVTS